MTSIVGKYINNAVKHAIPKASYMYVMIEKLSLMEKVNFNSKNTFYQEQQSLTKYLWIIYKIELSVNVFFQFSWFFCGMGEGWPASNLHLTLWMRRAYMYVLQLSSPWRQMFFTSNNGRIYTSWCCSLKYR